MWLIGFVDLVVFVLLPAHETEIEIARATPPNLKSHHKASTSFSLSFSSLSQLISGSLSGSCVGDLIALR
jgi:hypothetical protein